MIEGIVDNSVHLVGTIVKPARDWGRPWATDFNVGLYLELCVKGEGGKENVFAVYMPREDFNIDPLELTLGKEIVVDGFLNGDNGWHAVIAQSIKHKTNTNGTSNHFVLAGTLEPKISTIRSYTRANIINLDEKLKTQFRGTLTVGAKLGDLLKKICKEKIKIEGDYIESKMLWGNFNGKPYEHLVSDFMLKPNTIKPF